MAIIRRAAATAALVLAMLGMLACLAGAVGAWAVKTRAQGAATAIFAASDGALDFIGTRLGRVKARLDASRPRVMTLAGWAQRLQTLELEPDLTAAMEALREHLDTVASELKAAEGALDPIEAVARGVESAATAFAGTSIRAADVAAFAGDLATAASRLDALRVSLLQARERRLLARELGAACLTEAADLDTRLAKLSGSIDEVGARVTTARTSSAAAGIRVHRWITLGTLGLMAALLWFGMSQVCVLRHVSSLPSTNNVLTMDPPRS